MPADLVIKAINNLDLKQLSLENVELLQKMVPTDQEQKLYKEYVIEKKDLNLLTEEDKFMLQLTKVERISSKLSIMNYIGNFFDSLHLINPVRVHLIHSTFNITNHHPPPPTSKSTPSSPPRPRSNRRKSSAPSSK